MPHSVEEAFETKALDVFHKVQQGIDSNEFDRQVRQLLKIIEKTQLHMLITLDDLKWALKDDMFFHWNTTIRNVSDEKFIERFRVTILTTKTYDFYVPIYCLYNFPRSMALINTTVVDFQDLPKEIQDYFILLWQDRFDIDREFHHTIDKYVNLKKKSTFIHFIVKSNGTHKAIEQGKVIAEDVLHIIRFVYQINFNLIDIHFVEEESGNTGGLEGIAGLPFIGGANYDKLFGKSVNIISEIFSKRTPNEIEKRIKNAVRIFGTQTSIDSVEVRFLLLMTCLESLLMSEQDRDYILWRLAEKTAFLLGGDKRHTNDYIRNAYRKRSSFIHGSSRRTKPIVKDDVSKSEQIVGDVVWKLIIEFLNKGYTQIARSADTTKQFLSIDEYIEQEKFGETNDSS